MCGRYVSSRRPEDLIEEFHVTDPRIDAPLAPDYNVAPTKEVYAVLERRPVSGSVPGSGPRRQLRTLRWGLVPSWAKDPSIGNRMINARMETVADKPAYRRAFSARRCLLPADGYFEWYTLSSSLVGPQPSLVEPVETQPSSVGPSSVEPVETKPSLVEPVETKPRKPVKQPFFIHPRDGGVLAMAGLYEIWRDPTRTEDDPDAFRWTCTVLTTAAEDDLGHLHDRMPLMVPPDRWDRWLDPGLTSQEAGVETLLDLLVPAAPGRLEAVPVSKAVNNVRNNGPELLDPLPVQ